MKIGKAAVEPLIEQFRRSPGEVKEILEAFVAIGDSRAAGPILKRLEDWRFSWERERDADDTVSLINALAKLGDAFALADLDELAGPKPPKKTEEGEEENPQPVYSQAVSQAAKVAAAAIRARMKK